jgi:hypothetical protein
LDALVTRLRSLADFTSSVDDAVPWDAAIFAQRMERITDLTRVARHAGQSSHLAVGGDAPLRYPPHDAIDAFVGTYVGHYRGSVSRTLRRNTAPRQSLRFVSIVDIGWLEVLRARQLSDQPGRVVNQNRKMLRAYEQVLTSILQ